MWKTVLLTTLLAGTLDILAAFTNAYLRAGITPERVLRYVASGIFGSAAFTGSNAMMAWGLLFHFIIAFACTLCFFLLYPYIRSFLPNPWVNAFLIGAVAWCVTELLVLPMSQVQSAPITLTRVVVNMSILIVCIGLPIAFGAYRFYSQKS